MPAINSPSMKLDNGQFLFKLFQRDEKFNSMIILRAAVCGAAELCCVTLRRRSGRSLPDVTPLVCEWLF